MNQREGLSFYVNGNEIHILDQRQLPHEEIWRKVKSPYEMVEYIQSLAVRGAPLIAIAACYSLAQLAERGANGSDLLLAKEALRNSRPTAVNLASCLDLLMPPGTEPDPGRIITMAEKIFDDDVSMCDRIADYGAEFIYDGDGVAHHCNTGGLATAGCGTALGIIKRAYEQGKQFTVYVDETRPLLQGARLTVWELEKAGISYKLIPDGAAGAYMRKRLITKAFVGADRIAINGDFANKIGTYALAVLCYFHNLPFYMAAPVTTIDLNCRTGNHIVIEERDPDEVRGCKIPGKEFLWSLPDANVLNDAFDVTPERLWTRIITDAGVVAKNDVWAGRLRELARDMFK
jgi:methylthioribose-1-phosphate isomerase